MAYLKAVKAQRDTQKIDQLYLLITAKGEEKAIKNYVALHTPD